MENNIMGERLRSLRESAKLSQAKLAIIMDNVLQSAIARYEKGMIFPTHKTLLWYADYFDVSLDYIYGRTDSPRGKLYDCKPPIPDDKKDLAEFIEMCFDPNSPVNTRLKETMLKMLEEKRK